VRPSWLGLMRLVQAGLMRVLARDSVGQVAVRYLELVEELFANVRKLGQASPLQAGPGESPRQP
jgi:hypothetical protein